ncbi:MAG: glycosyltransferase family 2 protein [Candidatus Pacebacteria bacterium]|nr:glycosyltransferase family 2 protein [Candidatus Paceibacterota bacterium]
MISIIVPALNEENFLSECLKSLENQNYSGRYEIILVDNNSKDKTKEIGGKFKIKILHCPERGAFYARKMGADAALGDIIIQADADTIYPEDWLEKISNKFSENPRASAIAGVYMYRDPPYWAQFEYFVKNIFNALSAKIIGRPGLVSGANFAFRKNTFLEIGGYKKDSLYFDQYDISMRLSRFGKIIYDPKIIVLTSSRRVKKSSLFVLKHFAINVFKIFLYFIKSQKKNRAELSWQKH